MRIDGGYYLVAVEFTLFYDGPLPSDGTPKQRQAIRRVFHKQLKVLWTQEPLADVQYELTDSPKCGDAFVIKKLGVFRYAGLVTQVLSLVTEIDILMLWPEAPGSII